MRRAFLLAALLGMTSLSHAQILAPILAGPTHGGGGGGGPVFVSAANGHDDTGTAITSIATTTPNPWANTAGNSIWVQVSWFLTAGCTVTVADTANGSVYSQIGGITSETAYGGGGAYIAQFYAVGIAAASNNVVTASVTGCSFKYVRVIAAQFSGASTLDATATGTDSGDPPVISGSFSTTHANEIAFAGSYTDNNVTFTAGSGYTIPINGWNNGGGAGALEYQVFSSTQTGVTVSMNDSNFGGDNRVIVVATFY